MVTVKSEVYEALNWFRRRIVLREYILKLFLYEKRNDAT